MDLFGSSSYAPLCLVSVNVLVSSLLSLASLSLPLPSHSEHRCSFLLRAGCRPSTTIYSLLSIWTPNAFHLQRRAVCRRQDSNLDFSLSFPPLFLSLRSAHCIATGIGLNRINIPRLVSSKPDNCDPISPHSFACVSGELWPLSLRFLVSLAFRSDSRYRHP